MRITFDSEKRRRTLAERGLDFADAESVFAGKHFNVVDASFDYAEVRIATFGTLNGRMVTFVWTQRDDTRRIISMRYANDRERSRYAQHLGRS